MENKKVTGLEDAIPVNGINLAHAKIAILGRALLDVLTAQMVRIVLDANLVIRKVVDFVH